MSSMFFNNSPNGIILLNEDFEILAINKSALKIFGDAPESKFKGTSIIRYLDAIPFMNLITTGTRQEAKRVYLSEFNRYVEQQLILDRNYHQIMCILKDVTPEETEKRKREELVAQTLKIAESVSDKQMKTVQEIALLLGETAAETQIAITRLKESIKDE